MARQAFPDDAINAVFPDCGANLHRAFKAFRANPESLLFAKRMRDMTRNPMFLGPFHQFFADVFGAVVDP